MRTKVVSWDSAAVTELFGVLHVPQLYSLFESESGKGVPVRRSRPIGVENNSSGRGVRNFCQT